MIFDGKNCNLFSPNDTYALIENDDNYRLDCTSFMSTDTVTFEVKIVDENNIDLVRGGYVTELTRVEIRLPQSHWL